jgi:hypothetical protein
VTVALQNSFIDKRRKLRLAHASCFVNFPKPIASLKIGIGAHKSRLMENVFRQLSDIDKMVASFERPVRSEQIGEPNARNQPIGVRHPCNLKAEIEWPQWSTTEFACAAFPVSRHGQLSGSSKLSFGDR